MVEEEEVVAEEEVGERRGVVCTETQSCMDGDAAEVVGLVTTDADDEITPPPPAAVAVAVKVEVALLVLVVEVAVVARGGGRGAKVVPDEAPRAKAATKRSRKTRDEVSSMAMGNLH